MTFDECCNENHMGMDRRLALMQAPHFLIVYISSLDKGNRAMIVKFADDTKGVKRVSFERTQQE